MSLGRGAFYMHEKSHKSIHKNRIFYISLIFSLIHRKNDLRVRIESFFYGEFESEVGFLGNPFKCMKRAINRFIKNRIFLITFLEK